jgi:hypothetical protein
MHNKIPDSHELNHGNRSIRKSKSTSNLSVSFSSLQKENQSFSFFLDHQ